MIIELPLKTGSTIRTLLHGKINPKDWQVLSLSDVGFLLFFRVVSGHYGKPCFIVSLSFNEELTRLQKNMMCVWPWHTSPASLTKRQKKPGKKGRDSMDDWLVVWNIFYFHPYLGKWSNLTNIFQRGLKPPTIWYLPRNRFQSSNMWGKKTPCFSQSKCVLTRRWSRLKFFHPLSSDRFTLFGCSILRIVLVLTQSYEDYIKLFTILVGSSFKYFLEFSPRSLGTMSNLTAIFSNGFETHNQSSY